MTDPPRDGHDRAGEPTAGAEEVASRRRFLARISTLSTAAIGMLIAIPAVGLLLSPARREPRRWRPVGALDRFVVGETVQVTYLDPDPLPWAGFAGRSTAWLRRDGPQDFTAFSPYCTHVGCPVTWVAGAEMFMCPCHGGTFRRDGSVAAGPPPRPLDRLEVRVRSGQVEIRAAGVPAASA